LSAAVRLFSPVCVGFAAASSRRAARNDSKVPDRGIDSLAGHSAWIKKHHVVRRNVQLASKAIERYYFRGE
jgi:hypothetical protein